MPTAREMQGFSKSLLEKIGASDQQIKDFSKLIAKVDPAEINYFWTLYNNMYFVNKDSEVTPQRLLLLNEYLKDPIAPRTRMDLLQDVDLRLGQQKTAINQGVDDFLKYITNDPQLSVAQHNGKALSSGFQSAIANPHVKGLPSKVVFLIERIEDVYKGNPNANKIEEAKRKLAKDFVAVVDTVKTPQDAKKLEEFYAKTNKDLTAYEELQKLKISNDPQAQQAFQNIVHGNIEQATRVYELFKELPKLLNNQQNNISEMQRDLLLKFSEEVDAKGAKGAKDFADHSQAILQSLKESRRQYNNCVRIQGEIVQVEKDPGKVADAQAFAREVDRAIPLTNENSDGFRASAVHHRPGETSGPVFVAGDLFHKGEKDQIKRSDVTAFHAGELENDNYKALVKRATLEAKAAWETDEDRLKNLVASGCDLTMAQRKRVQYQHEGSIVLKNLADNTLDAVSDAVQKVGRGIFTKSKVAGGDLHRKYIRSRNEILTSMFSKMLSGKRNYAQHEKELLEMLAQQGDLDLLDQASFERLMDFFAKHIAAEKGINDKEMASYTDAINNLNANMLKEAKGLVEKSDDMWPWRILQVFLLVSPFAGFSVFGEMFNYISPLNNVANGLFGSGSFSDGVGGIIRGDAFTGILTPLKPLGALADVCGVDDATVLLLDNLPIVNSVVDAVTDNEIAQILLQNTLALYAVSPALQIVGAMAFNGYRLGKEVEHAKKISDHKEKHIQAIHDKFREMDENVIADVTDKKGNVTVGAANRIKSYVTEKMKIIEESNVTAELTRFIMDRKHQHSNGNANAFNGFAEITKINQDEPDRIIAWLQDPANKADAEALQKKFLLFTGLQRQLRENGYFGRLFNEKLDDQFTKMMAAPAGDEAVRSVVAEQNEYLKQEAVLDIASKKNGGGVGADRMEQFCTKCGIIDRSNWQVGAGINLIKQYTITGANANRRILGDDMAEILDIVVANADPNPAKAVAAISKMTGQDFYDALMQASLAVAQRRVAAGGALTPMRCEEMIERAFLLNDVEKKSTTALSPTLSPRAQAVYRNVGAAASNAAVPFDFQAVVLASVNNDVELYDSYVISGAKDILNKVKLKALNKDGEDVAKVAKMQKDERAIKVALVKHNLEKEEQERLLNKVRSSSCGTQKAPGASPAPYSAHLFQIEQDAAMKRQGIPVSA